MLTEITLLRAQEGGFLVLSQEQMSRPTMSLPLFAGTLDECLDFMKRKMSTETTT